MILNIVIHIVVILIIVIPNVVILIIILILIIRRPQWWRRLQSRRTLMWSKIPLNWLYAPSIMMIIVLKRAQIFYGQADRKG